MGRRVVTEAAAAAPAPSEVGQVCRLLRLPEQRLREVAAKARAFHADRHAWAAGGDVVEWLRRIVVAHVDRLGFGRLDGLTDFRAAAAAQPVAETPAEDQTAARRQADARRQAEFEQRRRQAASAAPPGAQGDDARRRAAAIERRVLELLGAPLRDEDPVANRRRRGLRLERLSSLAEAAVSGEEREALRAAAARAGQEVDP